jgi:glycosyltransferase involved in cell wall biosynthesis
MNRHTNETPRDFVFVQSTTEVGGAETALLNLFTASPDLRRRAVIVTLSFGEGDLPARLRAVGAEVVELPKARVRQPLRLARVVGRLRDLIRVRGARIVVANGAHPQIIAGLTARTTGARSVFLVHMIHAHPLWRNQPLDALAVASPCDLTLSVSEAAHAAMAKLRPSRDNRLLREGTPLRTVSEADRIAARAELGVAPHESLIGVFGRLQRWKGQDVFVKAAAKIASARPRSQFVVVGGSVFGLEPEFFQELKRTTAAFGLTDRLRFTGFRTDVPRLMAACDVVCHTSRVPEPFGLVVVEAMALGRPVVATEGGGPSEIVSAADLGVLVRPADAEALAAAVIALIDDPARRRAIGVRAAAHIAANFSIDVMAANLVRHLDDLLSRDVRPSL